MRLWLNHTGEVSLREQLITQVVLAILCKELLPGQRLPRFTAVNFPARNCVRAPVSWPIQRVPSASSNKLVIRLSSNSGVLRVSKILNRTPSNRTSPLYVPSHR